MSSSIFLISDQPLIHRQFDLPPEIQDQVKGGIPLSSYEFGMKQQVTTDVSNSARTSGRPVISDIACEKEIDETTTLLTDHCLRAIPLGEICRLLIINLEGDQVMSTMEYELKNLIIASYQISSIEGQTPRELLHLNFTDFRQTYSDFSGSETKTSSSGWSVSRNRPVDS
ncbi:MAG: Hcp1 family type VI secretion system effector [Roseivirga sp.]|nr:Hcp1 family type VI secretion system effector [Roseivirga sp.]